MKQSSSPDLTQEVISAVRRTVSEEVNTKRKSASCEESEANQFNNEINSDENLNVDEYYVKTKASQKQRHEFAYSSDMTTRERI